MTARALLLLGLGTAALSLSACNPAPYTQGDPPPSFAFRLVERDLRIRTQYAGSQLELIHRADAIVPGYLPTGWNYSWNGMAYFSAWNAVNGGRWPALWGVLSTGGCGIGSTANFTVDRKLIDLTCLIPTVPIFVNPGSYSSTAGVSSLALQFSAGANLPVTIYVVDPANSTVITGPLSTTLNGSAQAWVSVPSNLGAGNYMVLAESSAATGLGGSGDFTVFTPAPPPTGSDTLQPAGRLYANQSVSSQDLSHTLIYQSDGNLVLYGPVGPVWASMIASSPGRAEMQTDGNLVTRDGADAPGWDTQTFEAGSVLRVENQGRS